MRRTRMKRGWVNGRKLYRKGPDRVGDGTRKERAGLRMG